MPFGVRLVVRIAVRIGENTHGGSEDEAWHPVAEAFIVHEDGKGVSRSLLAGFTFRHSDAIRFDAGLRRGYGGSGPVTELRAGLTWTI